MDRVVNSSEFQVTVPVTHADGTTDSISLQPKAFAQLAPGTKVDPTFVLLNDAISFHPATIQSDGLPTPSQE